MLDGEQSRTVKCGECGLALPPEWSGSPDENPCPACGSVFKQVEITLVDTIPVPRDYLSYDVIDKAFSSRRNPRKQLVNRPSHSRDDDRMRDEYRLIDKYRNEYHKVITDQETGEIVYECHERLTDHQGRGSARAPHDSRHRSPKVDS